MAGEKLSRKGSVGAGQQQAHHEPTVCPGCQKGKSRFGVNLIKCRQLVKRGDSSTIFSIDAASP